MSVKSANDKLNFILKMLDEYTYNRFQSTFESLMRETRVSLQATKSERLIDNKIRGFFLQLVDQMIEMNLLVECKCGGVTVMNDKTFKRKESEVTVTSKNAQNIQYDAEKVMTFNTP